MKRRSPTQICQSLFWRFAEKTFRFWQALGLHVTPNHFYQPVPDTRFLAPELWAKHSDLPGIDMPSGKKQAAFLDSFSWFRSEYDGFPRKKIGSQLFYLDNLMFESVDAEVYYSMIRLFRPARILEVGSGFSTYLAIQAIIRNGTGTLTAIEPYPSKELLCLPSLDRLVRSKVETVPLEEFTSLSSGDILFIDSSHTVKIGNDVLFLYLEVFPRLKPGVIIHVHDVFLPSHYPKEWVLNRQIFWTEQYLLQAFLSMNSSFEIIFAASYMHLNHPDILEKYFSSYNRLERWPGSFWMRRKL